MSNINLFFSLLQTSEGAPPIEAPAVLAFDSKTGTSPTSHVMTSVPAGSLIVLTTSTEASGTSATITSSPSLTWSKRVDAQGSETGGAEIYTARFAAGGDITVNSSWGNSIYQASVCYTVANSLESSGGTSGTAVTQTAPSVSVSTSRANSIIFACTADWLARNGSTRVYRADATERLYHRVAEWWTTYHYYKNATTPGTYTMGLTTPSTMKAATAVLEIRQDIGPDTTPPSAPVLSSPSTTSSTINLSWTDSIDNVGVTGYEVYVGGVLRTTTSSTTYTVTGLAASTSYSIYVRAKDAAGNGTNSNTITPTTTSSGSVTEFSKSVIATTTADFTYTPGRGAEQWHDQNRVNIPAQGTNTKRSDKYYRFIWSDLQKGEDDYDWTYFNQEINNAITNNQKFSFGIMSHNASANSGTRGIVNLGGGKYACYPEYLHDQMMSESVKPFTTSETNIYVPNWNSDYYLTAMEDFHEALNQHIMESSYSGVDYKDVIGYIDIRGYGSYGEWHHAGIIDTMANLPSGIKATDSTLMRIIDAHVTKFTDFPLVIIFNAFDGNRLANTLNSPAIARYALLQENNWGKIGWRRDNWGATDSYITSYTSGNNITVSGMNLATEITNRWKYAPIVGEPSYGWAINVGGCDYGDLENQVKIHHAVSFGNGNMADWTTTCITNNVRAASKAAGFRYVINGGSVTSTVPHNGTMTVTVNWQNNGITPTYEPWEVLFELKSGSTVVWSDTSSKVMKLFLPSVSGADHQDNFTIPDTITPGTYKLTLKVVDPNGYRAPMPLYITGVNGDGSYDLANVTITS